MPKRTNKPQPDRIITVRLTEQQFESLTRLAIRRSTQSSTYVRELINETCYEQDPKFREYLDAAIEDAVRKKLSE